jgi:hypothetical protein
MEKKHTHWVFEKIFEGRWEVIDDDKEKAKEKAKLFAGHDNFFLTEVRECVGDCANSKFITTPHKFRSRGEQYFPLSDTF